MLENMFKPLKINKMEIKNRFVVSGMVTCYANPDHMANEKFIAYHEAKAKGGYGLIITEDYLISPEAGGFLNLFGLWNDELVESHRKLTERVHAAGGKIVCQIYHAGREAKLEHSKTGEIYAPSAIKDPTQPTTPRELTVEEIKNYVVKFAETAAAAKKAGFDGVEIHGGHGYLLNQFMSPFSNRRSDEYGGSLTNRMRFPLEVVKAVREAVGPDYPLLFRMSSQEYVEDGLTIEESKAIAIMLEKASIDCINCSQGIYTTRWLITPPSYVTNGWAVDNAAEIKKVVNIPVTTVGRITDPIMADSILASGKADLVVMARASLADPDMPNKAKEGRYEDIHYCIGCIQGCSGENGKGNPIRCLVNPRTGMENVYNITPVEKPKKILVAGGGVAGCEAAVVAAQRGHKVTLYEASDRLGGQWNLASIPPSRGAYSTVVNWHRTQMRKLGVEVKLNTSLTKELAMQEQPDAIIVATGSKPFKPPIKGAELPHVVFAHDVLRGKVELGKDVVVIGGGLVGSETAEHFSIHKPESKYTIIEMMDDIVRDGIANSNRFLKITLKENDVDVFTSATVTEITEDEVKYKFADGVERSVKADTVIMAVGVKADPTLYEELLTLGCEVVKAGDAHDIKNGYRNLRQGYEVGYSI